MMFSGNTITLVLAISATCVAASPFPSLGTNPDHPEGRLLQMRASTSVNPDAVTDTKCIDTSAKIAAHDENVALLGICGGIAGKIQKCGGAPRSTSGSSGTALFQLHALDSGATINVSKGRWEGCVRAAKAVCPSGAYSATCVGGASTGNIAFSLSAQ